MITCPHCGSAATVRAENESDHQSKDTLPLVLITALLVLGTYFAFLLYAYLAYPLTVLLFAAATALFSRWKEKHRRNRALPPRQYYCLDCGKYFQVDEKES
jgi:DNA-directed RNA polymerase subunit RPC12/RpoP